MKKCDVQTERSMILLFVDGVCVWVCKCSANETPKPYLIVIYDTLFDSNEFAT